MAFASSEELIAEIGAGRMVVLVDDEDRENEGDLVMAAVHLRAEHVNFMATHARGLICLAMTEERCRRLGLPPMVASNESPLGTAFTVSIEAAEGVTTGISAFDRARTIAAAVAPDAKPEDLRKPGHVFPLMARPGGVLVRAGHTEAACDLARLAGLEPAGVLVEIMGEDGRMARRPELEAFAARHGLKLGSIADLIGHRLRSERSLAPVHEGEVNTRHGRFRMRVYRDLLDGRLLHTALWLGNVADAAPVLARVQLRQEWRDLGLGDGPGVDAALAAIADAGRGVLVLLDHAASVDERLAMLQAPPTRAAEPLPWRTTGCGAQILKDLGIHALRLLGPPRRYVGLEGYGLHVVEHVGW